MYILGDLVYSTLRHAAILNIDNIKKSVACFPEWGRVGVLTELNFSLELYLSDYCK